MRPGIVVVGGGLAGCMAALDCADAGAQVTLVERRRHLGGLTWSFSHGGHAVDNGQHVFLRCCAAYLGFLHRIGSAGSVALQKRLDVPVLDPVPGGAPVAARLRRNSWPAPLHLAPSLLRYRHLPLAARLRVGQAALALRTVHLDDPALDRVTFAEWLGARGQSPAAIRALWDPITVATINLPAAQASAAMGAKVFQTGLLTDPAAADVGWSTVPLGRLHGEAAAAALARVGAKVVTGCRARAVVGDPRPEVVLDDGTRLPADAVVVALPHWALPEVVGPAHAPAAARLQGLGTSPIVNVHVVYDRAVTTLPFAASLRGPVQWVFDRTVSSGLEPLPEAAASAPPRSAAAGGSGGVEEQRSTPGRRQYLAVTLSAADAYLGQAPGEVAAAVTGALADLFPAARSAQILDTLVTKERSATFRAVPGTSALRPGPVAGISGVVLAGAWTDTGWPATMEGAVRSGHAAARAALVAAGSPRRLPEEVA